MRLGVREVARLFEVSERTVYRWVREDELPAHEVEGQSRFHRAEVLEWATGRDLTPSPELFDGEAATPETAIGPALARGGVHHGVPAGDRAEALRAIVQRLPIAAPTDRADLEAVLLARPGLGKVGGFGEGVGIPHVRHPIVLDVPLPTLTLCFLDRRVDFGALDGQPIGAAFVQIAPTARAHLAMLSRLAFVLHDARVRAALEARAPADDVARAIAACEALGQPGGTP